MPDRHDPTCSRLRIIAAIITSLALAYYLYCAVTKKKKKKKNQRPFVGSTWRTFSTSFSLVFFFLFLSLSLTLISSLSLISPPFVLATRPSFHRFFRHVRQWNEAIHETARTYDAERKQRKLNEIERLNVTNTTHRIDLPNNERIAAELSADVSFFFFLFSFSPFFS